VLKVKDIMTKEAITVGPDDEVWKAASLLLENHINGAPVVDEEGRLLGILCQSDLVAQQRSFPLPSVFTLLDGLIPLRGYEKQQREVEKMSAITVAQAMTQKPVTLSPEDTVEKAATIMVEKKLYTLPVVEEGRVVGVVGKEDVLRIML